MYMCTYKYAVMYSTVHVHYFFFFLFLFSSLPLFSVEVIRLGLSFLINWDVNMYYETNDLPAVAR